MASKSSYEPSYVIEIPAGSLFCAPFLSGAAEQLFVIAAARQVQQPLQPGNRAARASGNRAFCYFVPVYAADSVTV